MSDQRLTPDERAAIAAGCAECGKEMAGDEPIEDGLLGTNNRTGQTYAFCSRDCADLFNPGRAQLPRRELLR